MCFRLYTEQGFNALTENTDPEILRCNLSNVILTLKASGVEHVLSFDFLDPPPRAALVRALEHLYALRALDSSGEITKEGRKMAEFPVDPALAKVLLYSKVCPRRYYSLDFFFVCFSVVFSPNPLPLGQYACMHILFFIIKEVLRLKLPYLTQKQGFKMHR
jgi:hypothetical protein